MKTLLNENEVLELSVDVLDLNNPDPDKVHNIAMRMDMIFHDELDLYEDTQGYYIQKLKRNYEDRIKRVKVQYAELKERVSPASNA